MATSLEFAVVNDGMSSGLGVKLRVAGSPTRTSGWGEAGTAVHEGMTAPQTWLDGTIYPGGLPKSMFQMQGPREKFSKNGNWIRRGH